MSKTHLALYGSVQIVRTFCDDCERWAWVIKGEKQCCDAPLEDGEKPTVVKRMSQSEFKRRIPSVDEQRRILAAQNYRCLYCDAAFDGWARYHKQYRKIKVVWDHRVPYAYTLDNRHQNFAAACQFCNSWKAALIFETVDEVRVYVAQKWEQEKARDEAV